MFNWSKLWCAGKLGNCPTNLTRLRFTCLICRWRRQYYGSYRKPPFWIEYTYASIIDTENNVTTYHYILIDPRGSFTSLRCAIIVMLDKMMKRLHITKPLVEFCEFFANYPV